MNRLIIPKGIYAGLPYEIDTTVEEGCIATVGHSYPHDDPRVLEFCGNLSCTKCVFYEYGNLRSDLLNNLVTLEAQNEE